jgi:hypothetical protein
MEARKVTAREAGDSLGRSVAEAQEAIGRNETSP